MTVSEEVRKTLPGPILATILAAVVFGVCLYFYDDEMLTLYERNVLWDALALFVFLILRVSSSFRRMLTGEDRGARDILFLCVLFAIIAVIFSHAAMDEWRSYTANMGFLVPMLVSLIGGRRLGLMSATVSAAVQIVVLHDSPGVVVVSVAVLFASALIAGMPSMRDSATSRLIYVIPPLITVFATALVFVVLALIDDYVDPGAVVLHMSLPMLILGMITVVGYDFIRKTVVFLTDLSRRNNDLQAAREIQMSAVPTEYPVSATARFSGLMEPAVEVGGDFYDVFKIGEGQIGLVIADVSGKGLPASLFMMRAQATIRANAMAGLDPHDVLARSNAELATRNDAGQFVTAWFGILDTDTCTLMYSNAGHTLPYMIRKGEVIAMEQPKGLVMGFSRKAVYRDVVVDLDEDADVFLYTDGVNEAFDSEQRQFGQERIVESLSRIDLSDPDAVIHAIREDIRSFVGDAPVSDDITMLSFRVSTGGMVRFRFESNLDSVETVIDSVHSHLVSSGCPENAVLKMDIVVEEIFVNICRYAYGESKGDVTICSSYDEGTVRLSFIDTGTPFDPLARGEVTLPESVSQWPIGGLGIHMALKLTDSARYKRIIGCNVLTFSKKV